MNSPVRKLKFEEGKHTIIQCPSCQTKFAVDGTALVKLDSPRFHCSRCDNVFNRPADPLPPTRPTAVAKPAPAPVETKIIETDEIESFEEEIDSDPLAPSGLKPIKPSASMSMDAVEVESVEVQREVSQRAVTPAPKPAPSASRALQIPRSYDSSLRAQAPHEHLGEDLPDGFTHTELRDDEEEETISHIPTVRTVNAREKALFSAATLDEDYAKYAIPSSIAIDVPSTPAVEKPAPAPAMPVARPRPMAAPEARTGWRAFALLSCPVVGFLVLLAGLAVPLSSDGSLSRQFLSLGNAPVKRVAPSGLHLENTEFKKVVLDNGESVHIISGELVNDSEESFREIVLEGVTFSSAGRPISNVHVNAGANLAKTRIKSLTPDVIKSFQASEAAKRFELKPGQRQEVSMAIFGPDVNRAGYYSARVYSVR